MSSTTYETLKTWLGAVFDEALKTAAKKGNVPPTITRAEFAAAEGKFDYVPGGKRTIKIHAQGTSGGDYARDAFIDLGKQGQWASMELTDLGKIQLDVAWPGFLKDMEDKKDVMKDPAVKKAIADLEKKVDDEAKAKKGHSKAVTNLKAALTRQSNLVRTLKGVKRRERHPKGKNTFNQSKKATFDQETAKWISAAKGIWTDTAEQRDWLKDFSDVMEPYGYAPDKVIDHLCSELDKIASGAPDVSSMAAFIETWASYIIDPDNTSLSTDSGADAADVSNWRNAIPNKAFDPIDLRWSKETATRIEELAEGKRSFSGYLQDSYKAWYKFALSSWDDGVTGKLLTVVKAPLSVLGILGQFVLDLVAKPVTGVSIGRNFADNQGIDLTYIAPVSKSSSSSST